MSVVSFPSTQNMAYKHTLGRTREADFIKPEAFLSPWMCCPAHPPRAYLTLKWLPCWSKDLIGSTHCFSLWRDPGKRQQLWLELWMLIRNTGRTAMPSSGHPGDSLKLPLYCLGQAEARECLLQIPGLGTSKGKSQSGKQSEHPAMSQPTFSTEKRGG